MLLISKTYDSWTFERIARHVLYWSAWLVFYAVVNEGAFENGNYSSWLIFELCVLPIKLSLVYFTLYYLFPKYVVTKKYTSFFLIVLGLTIVGGFIFRAVDYYYVSRYLISSESFLEKIDDSQYWTFHIAYKAIDLLFVVSLVIPVKLIQLQTRQERKTQEILTQKLETELQYLKHQLQPHFLFNTLNNLYGMVITGNKKAGEIVIKLSEIMSYMLYDSNGRLIPLEKEISNLKNYIDLEKLRHGDELSVSFTVKGQPKGRAIAPLILVSFLENAFKHGISENLENSWITITVEIRHDSLYFEVENSLHKADEKKSTEKVHSGLGLSNVKKRLELIYGELHTLEIAKSDTYSVQLELMDNPS